MKTRDTGLILLISSRVDPAGNLIHDEVMRLLSERPDMAVRYQHRREAERLIYLDGGSLLTEADLIIFLSRHSSVDQRPVLTVHVTGNFGDAAFGGNPGTLTPAATRHMHAIINRLYKEVPKGYTVTYEATHHGPTGITVPSCFVEVGSTEKEWHDRIAAEAVARAVIDAEPGDVVSLAGFGGTHYAKRQTEISLTTRGGFGHIMPTRDLVHLDLDMFSEIIHDSRAQAVYIDRKSLSRDEIGKIEGFAKEINIPVVGQSDLERLKALPFDEYMGIITLAHQVVPGSSVRLHNINRGADPVLVTVAADLVSEASKVNPTALDAGLDLLPVAHLSGNGIAYYPVFITSKQFQGDIRNQIVCLCLSIIRSYYGDRITISGGLPGNGDDEQSSASQDLIITLTELKFSPDIAAELGVTPGKDFGRLAAGEAVSVGDRVVTQDQVFVKTIRKIYVSGNE